MASKVLRPTGRPAESITGAAALAALLAMVFGVDDREAQAAMIAGLGLLPAAVTLLVSNGGLRGVLRLLWRGREAPEDNPAG